MVVQSKIATAEKVTALVRPELTPPRPFKCQVSRSLLPLTFLVSYILFVDFMFPYAWFSVLSEKDLLCKMTQNTVG